MFSLSLGNENLAKKKRLLCLAQDDDELRCVGAKSARGARVEHRLFFSFMPTDHFFPVGVA